MTGRPGHGRHRSPYCRSGTVLLPFAPVHSRGSLALTRTLFEPLGDSHDCRAFYSRNSGRIQINVGTRLRIAIVGQSRKKKKKRKRKKKKKEKEKEKKKEEATLFRPTSLHDWHIHVSFLDFSSFFFLPPWFTWLFIIVIYYLFKRWCSIKLMSCYASRRFSTLVIFRLQEHMHGETSRGNLSCFETMRMECIWFNWRTSDGIKFNIVYSNWLEIFLLIIRNVF